MIVYLTTVKQNEKIARLQAAVEAPDNRTMGGLIVELLIELDEDPAEIAVDFIENEVGRLDWTANWQVIKEKEDPLAKVQTYLRDYGLMADAQEIVNIIDRMAVENPGRWK